MSRLIVCMHVLGGNNGPKPDASFSSTFTSPHGPGVQPRFSQRRSAVPNFPSVALAPLLFSRLLSSSLTTTTIYIYSLQPSTNLHTFNHTAMSRHHPYASPFLSHTNFPY